MPCRWCGGLTFLWPSVVSCLTTTICSIIYVQCTHFSLWWCMEHWVYITSTMKIAQWWLQRFWPAFLWWSWFGKFLDSLTYSGARLHSFWVSNIRNLNFCIISLVMFFVVTFVNQLIIPEITGWFHSTESHNLTFMLHNLLFMLWIERFYCLSRLKLWRPPHVVDNSYCQHDKKNVTT